MRISDWSSDVCSSDLLPVHQGAAAQARNLEARMPPGADDAGDVGAVADDVPAGGGRAVGVPGVGAEPALQVRVAFVPAGVEHRHLEVRGLANSPAVDGRLPDDELQVPRTPAGQIGGAEWRESGCRGVVITGGAGSL